MKKKHRLEKFFSSVFGAHVHNENSDALPNREDVEKDVERILEILRTEDSRQMSSDKSELAYRLEDFLKGYQEVHGRYNHLLGKITKKFRPKSNDNGSFSIDLSSDSDSSDSGSEKNSYKKSSRIQENNADLIPIEDYYTLQRQLESANIKISELESLTTTMSTELEAAQALTSKLAEKEASIITLKDSVQALQAERDVLKIEVATLLRKGDDMNQKVTNLQAENETLRSENADAFGRIHDMEKSIGKYEVELNQIKNETERVNFESKGLKEELERMTKQVENLTQQLTTSSEENKTLRSGNFVFMKRIQEAEKALADFRDQADQKFKLAIEEATSQNARLSSENENLKLTLDAAGKQNSDLLQRISAAEDEISSLKSENLRLSNQIEGNLETIEVMTTDIGNLKAENLNLLNMNSDLNRLLTVKEAENETLESGRLEAIEVKKQAEEEISVLSKEIEKVKDEKSESLACYAKLELDLQQTKDSFSELKLILEATQEEKQSLVTENLALTHKIQQVEKAIDDFKAETNQLAIDKSEMEIKINDLRVELHTADAQSANLKKAVEAAEEKNRILTLQSSEVLSKLQKVEIDMKQLQEELENLREDNSMMQQIHIKLQEAENVIVDLKAESEKLRVDNAQLKVNVCNLHLELEASNLQLANLNAKVEQLREEISTLEHNHNDLQTQKFDLEVRLDEKLSEILSLQMKLEEVQEKATDRIKSSAEQVDDLEREKDLLNNQKNEMEEHIRSLTSRSLEEEETIKTLQEELKGRIHNEEVTLKDQRDSFEELLSNYKKLQACFQESCQKLESMEAVNEKQMKEIGQLEETCKELSEKLELIEAEKEDADRETAKLHKQVQNLEVQIRLSNQKLKITETENKETEEGYKTTIEALREECRELDGKFARLSVNYSVLEKELRQLKKLSEVEMSALANRYCELESLFKEKSAHLPFQISECSKELKLLKNWFELLKNEKQELSVRLQYKEGVVSKMKDEAEGVAYKLAKTEKELAMLRTKEDESAKRIKALEEMLGEKKREVSDKDEAKREAIRQLCLLIEYHRENCMHLSQYLSSVLKRSGRSPS